MIESPIPQDILKYKTKFIGNFSIRESIFLVLAGISAATAFFVFLSDFPTRPRIILTALFALPFLIFGFFTIIGQPLEKVLFDIIVDNFLTPIRIPKEVRYPELEKFEKSRNFESATADNKKKSKSNGKKIKIKSSKEFKSIK